MSLEKVDIALPTVENITVMLWNSLCMARASMATGEWKAFDCSKNVEQNIWMVFIHILFGMAPAHSYKSQRILTQDVETVITCNSPKINHLYTRYLQTIAAKEDRSTNR